jgi:hypothetical protein
MIERMGARSSFRSAALLKLAGGAALLLCTIAGVSHFVGLGNGVPYPTGGRVRWSVHSGYFTLGQEWYLGAWSVRTKWEVHEWSIRRLAHVRDAVTDGGFFPPVVVHSRSIGVSVWLLVFLIAVPCIVIALRSLRSQKLLSAGMLCRSCGYDLRLNTSGLCPECGANVPTHFDVPIDK